MPPLKNGSEKWTIRYGPSFKSSLQKFVKSHYRKSTKFRRKFEELIRKIKAYLSQEPLPYGAELEPTKHLTTLSKGYRLAKYRFKAPGLSGAAEEGRLLYLIDDQAHAIILLMLYSHKDYVKRPPSRLISDLIREAIK